MTGGTSAKTLNTPTRQAEHRYIMFLPGVCAYPYSDPYCYGRVSSANRSRATFRTLIAAMARAKIRYIPLYFSYNALQPAFYSVADTHHSISVSAAALGQQLARIWAVDRRATFVLVGHSLGGVVAVGWDAKATRQQTVVGVPTLQHRIHSIVTFDSPVRGLPSLYTNTFAAQVFGGAVLSSLRPDSAVIRQILSFSDLWWGTAGHLHTVANRADKIVPSNRSTLGVSRVVNDNICGRDLFLIRSCHGAVLSDSSLNSWVACHWITTAQQCQAGPTPTPTPRPSPTPTPTLAPSPTTTPLITSTAMPQASPTQFPSPPGTPSSPHIQRTIP